MKIKQSQMIRFYDGEKVPRKIKKQLLGLKCTKRELKLRLANIKVINSYNTYGGVTLNDYFCPKCGCDLTRNVYHDVEYPELWNDYYCLRCGHHVAYEDNSPYIHCLEYPEDNYNLD